MRVCVVNQDAVIVSRTSHQFLNNPKHIPSLKVIPFGGCVTFPWGERGRQSVTLPPKGILKNPDGIDIFT